MDFEERLNQTLLVEDSKSLTAGVESIPDKLELAFVLAILGNLKGVASPETKKILDDVWAKNKAALAPQMAKIYKLIGGKMKTDLVAIMNKIEKTMRSISGINVGADTDVDVDADADIISDDNIDILIGEE